MIWSDSGFDTDSDFSLKREEQKRSEILGIVVVMPTNEHGNTSPHDVKSSPLFLHQFCTFSCKRTSPVRRISHQRTRGRRWSGSSRSSFLWQLPFLLHVKRRRNGRCCCGGRRNRSHFLSEVWSGFKERFELWQKWKVVESEWRLKSGLEREREWINLV